MTLRCTRTSIASAVALLAAACAQSDEPASKPQALLDFEVAAPSSGPTTTLNIPNFNVCAYTSDNGYQMIMDNVKVRRTGLNSWYYEPAVKWPDKPVTFMAVSPMDIRINVNPYWHTTINYRTDNGHTDLVIAVKADAMQTDGRLRMNFCHTMAKVDISVVSTVPDTEVYLKEAILYNVCVGGEFYFPDFSTPAGHPDIDGCWPTYISDQAHGMFPYYIADEGRALRLTDRPQHIDNQGNIFLIPFTFPPLHENNGHIAGSAIRLTCRFVSPATGEIIWPDKETPYQLLPDANNRDWGYIFFPLQDDSRTSGWRPGMNYNYRLTIAQAGTLPALSSRNAPGNTVALETSRY